MKPVVSPVAISIGTQTDRRKPQPLDVDLVRSSLLGLVDCQSGGDFH
jgi:hypothetical protein